MNRNIGLLFLILIASPAWAQLYVTVKPSQSVVTIETSESTQLQTVDGIAIGKPSKRVLSPVIRPGAPSVVLLVKHERPTDELLIKLKCRTADVITIEPGVYAIIKPGRHEIEVNVIGQNPLTWDDETVVVEVGSNPNPPTPPGPTPVPPSPPAPDDGSFDGLAEKVAQHARQLGQVQRNQIAGVLGTAADKMRSFEFRQAKQAVDYIARNWPPCESPQCGAIYKMVAEDAKNRQLSWQETQDYYRTIAKGMLQ